MRGAPPLLGFGLCACSLALLLLVASGSECWPDARLALALLLLVAPGSECWPDARLALGFALARGFGL